MIPLLKIKGYRSTPINKLIDAVNASRLISGRGYSVRETQQGIQIDLEDNSFLPDSLPFQVEFGQIPQTGDWKPCIVVKRGRVFNRMAGSVVDKVLGSEQADDPAFYTASAYPNSFVAELPEDDDRIVLVKAKTNEDDGTGGGSDGSGDTAPDYVLRWESSLSNGTGGSGDSEDEAEVPVAIIAAVTFESPDSGSSSGSGDTGKFMMLEQIHIGDVIIGESEVLICDFAIHPSYGEGGDTVQAIRRGEWVHNGSPVSTGEPIDYKIGSDPVYATLFFKGSDSDGWPAYPGASLAWEYTSSRYAMPSGISVLIADSEQQKHIGGIQTDGTRGDALSLGSFKSVTTQTAADGGYFHELYNFREEVSGSTAIPFSAAEENSMWTDSSNHLFLRLKGAFAFSDDDASGFAFVVREEGSEGSGAFISYKKLEWAIDHSFEIELPSANPNLICDFALHTSMDGSGNTQKVIRRGQWLHNGAPVVTEVPEDYPIGSGPVYATILADEDASGWIAYPGSRLKWGYTAESYTLPDGLSVLIADAEQQKHIGGIQTDGTRGDAHGEFAKTFRSIETTTTNGGYFHELYHFRHAGISTMAVPFSADKECSMWTEDNALKLRLKGEFTLAKSDGTSLAFVVKDIDETGIFVNYKHLAWEIDHSFEVELSSANANLICDFAVFPSYEPEGRLRKAIRRGAWIHNGKPVKTSEPENYEIYNEQTVWAVLSVNSACGIALPGDDDDVQWHYSTTGDSPNGVAVLIAEDGKQRHVGAIITNGTGGDTDRDYINQRSIQTQTNMHGRNLHQLYNFDNGGQDGDYMVEYRDNDSRLWVEGNTLNLKLDGSFEPVDPNLDLVIRDRSNGAEINYRIFKIPLSVSYSTTLPTGGGSGGGGDNDGHGWSYWWSYWSDYTSGVDSMNSYYSDELSSLWDAIGKCGCGSAYNG